MKRINIEVAILIFFILFVFVLPKIITKENKSETMLFYKEYFSKGIKGKIKNVQSSKGGFTILSIKDSKNNRENISVDKSFRYDIVIKEGNIFEKISNSNKCIYIAGDSAYYFDCFREIPAELKDSIEVKEWPVDIKGKWLPINHVM